MNTIVKNKWTWIIGTALLVGSFFLITTSQSNAADEKTVAGETAIAFVGDLAESATASGEVEAARKAKLSLLTSGVVEAVHVEVGSSVTAGETVVELDSVNLKRAVESAESALKVAEAELDSLLAAPSTADLASAEAAVASAQAALDSLLAGPTAEAIAASQAAVDAAQANMWAASGSLSANYETNDADILQAEINLESAQEKLQAADEAWIRAADCTEDSAGNITCVPSNTDRMEQATLDVQAARAEVAAAEANLDSAQNPDANTVAGSQATVAARQANYDAAVARHEALIAPPTADEIASAEASLASAQATLDTLLAGPLATDIQTRETTVAQARTNLAEAQHNLADAVLTAPFDGTVTAVHVAEGETASGVAVEIVDASQLEVVLNVDEIDLGKLSVGQEAIIWLETWPDAEITSEVIAISPSAVSNNGLVNFDVYLSIGETDLPILIGMTANANLITANTADVLLVPNAAITADRDNDRYYVNLVTADQSTQEVEVTIGLRDSEFTQITSGLSEGDEVAIGELVAPVQEGGFGPGR